MSSADWLTYPTLPAVSVFILSRNVLYTKSKKKIVSYVTHLFEKKKTMHESFMKRPKITFTIDGHHRIIAIRVNLFTFSVLK